MNLDVIRESLNEHFNVITEAAGVVTAKKSYYRGITKSGEHCKDIVLKILPNAQIIDYGNHCASAIRLNVKDGSTDDSYFYVKFTLKD